MIPQRRLLLPLSFHLPLETVLQQLAEMQRRGLAYETAAARIELLQDALAQMRIDPECSLEMYAPLPARVGDCTP